jgi:hypothetical protein
MVATFFIGDDDIGKFNLLHQKLRYLIPPFVNSNMVEMLEKFVARDNGDTRVSR